MAVNNSGVSNSLKIIFWNVRSANNKMSEIISYFSDCSANIGLLTENWQTSCVPGEFDSFTAEIKDIAATENYHIDCISCPRPSGGRGGGRGRIGQSGKGPTDMMS